MEIKEKIKRYYKGMGITISDKDIAKIMKDNKRTKEIMRFYKKEETEAMNYILGKPKDNKEFTRFELEATSKIDLFNKNTVNICKIIWENKDNPERLEKFLEQIGIDMNKL